MGTQKVEELEGTHTIGITLEEVGEETLQSFVGTPCNLVGIGHHDVDILDGIQTVLPLGSGVILGTPRAGSHLQISIRLVVRNGIIGSKVGLWRVGIRQQNVGIAQNTLRIAGVAIHRTDVLEILLCRLKEVVARGKGYTHKHYGQYMFDSFHFFISFWVLIKPYNLI